MKISVVLCTYNGARFLEKQLRSIAAQDRPPDELVICDDGSTDDTLAIVGRFSGRQRFDVRLEVNERNLGPARNFARGVVICRGDVIALADQDDEWLPGKLSRIERAIAENPEVGLVFSDATLVDERGRRLPRRLWGSLGFGLAQQRKVNCGRAVEVFIKRNVVTGACMAFRAAHRDLVLPIAGGWMHDAWFGLLIAAVAPVMAIAEPLTYYRQHRGQQIGADESFGRQFLRGRRQTLRFEAIAEEYEAAYRRLSEFRTRLRDDRVLSLLQEKADHFRMKARMRQQAGWRLPAILHELFRGHYARCSRGWKSLAQDLFL